MNDIEFGGTLEYLGNVQAFSDLRINRAIL
jgi:hypothetical protein